LKNPNITKAYRNKFVDSNSKASPTNIQIIPTYIGFLTYRYKPLTTSFPGGEPGHRKALPENIRLQADQKKANMPTRIGITPINRKAPIPKVYSSTFEVIIQYGIRPKNTGGAKNKKPSDPTAETTVSNLLDLISLLFR
jgi:hypothetical protein